jgi:hypothetical protein
MREYQYLSFSKTHWPCAYIPKLSNFNRTSVDSQSSALVLGDKHWL